MEFKSGNGLLNRGTCIKTIKPPKIDGLSGVGGTTNRHWKSNSYIVFVVVFVVL